MIDLAVRLRDLPPTAAARSRQAGLTVVVADDHAAARGELRVMLGAAADVIVVAEAADEQEVVREVLAHRPDVLLVDQRMSGRGGIAAIRQVRRCAPETAVLIFTTAGDDESVLAAMRAGASGYLLKGAGPDDIVRAVRGVAAGEAIFCQDVAHRVLDLIARPRVAEPFPDLTAREREVLQLVIAGLGNADIARHLRLAPKTVRNHICAILAKLGVADRASAIAHARQWPRLVESA